MLSLALFAALAASCGPAVHPATLAAVARTESRFNPLAINDNQSGRSYAPASLPAAVAIASALCAQGHALDLGLMQINSATLPRLGLALAEAFDPCASLRAAARLLTEGYRPQAGSDPQDALLRALSRYNTGSPDRGIANGYVTKVQAAAEQVVPALRPAVPQTAGSASTITPFAPPPAWDVYGQAQYARARGAATPVPSSPAALPPQPPRSGANTVPVILEAPPAAAPPATAETTGPPKEGTSP